MKLKSRLLDIEAGGKYIIVLNKETGEELGVHSLDRVNISHKDKKITCIADISKKMVKRDEVGIYNEVKSELGLNKREEVDVNYKERPVSVEYIKEKLENKSLNHEKIKSIVEDVVDRKLSDIEISYFIAGLHINGMDMEESESLTRSMVETGETIDTGHPTFDKHSLGGVPGDKTSMLVVPIVASAGLKIPKTSSRAITSPAGTADRMEVLADVNLGLDKIKKVVKKTNGCLVWGGAVNLAPADDSFIQVEYPLGVDPLFLPSVMSKKKAVGSDYVVIDIPTGRGTKIKTKEEGNSLSEDFIELGRRVGLNVKCAITYGGQPLGHNIGPALEAREALETLMRKKRPGDLIEKVVSIAGLILESGGIKNGKKEAERILESGEAEKKFREIIREQGGKYNIKPSEIKLGGEVMEIKSNNDGKVLHIENPLIVEIAKGAGAPKDKGAGVELVKKMGDNVKKGETLFKIYSKQNNKLKKALSMMDKKEPIVVRKDISKNMLMETIPNHGKKHYFYLER